MSSQRQQQQQQQEEGEGEKPFTIEICSDADLSECFATTSESFTRDSAPFFDAYFPHHRTDAGRLVGSQRLLNWKRGDPDATFLKVSVLLPLPVVAGQDKESEGKEKREKRERIVGVAVWTHMMEAPSEDLADSEDLQGTWKDEEDREYMRQLWRGYVGPRSRAVVRSGGRGAYVLELLAVHPDYQRRGIGRSLVNWGTSAAQENNLEAVVESSQRGRKTYTDCGFTVEIERMRLDVDDRFKDRSAPNLTFMTWTPKV